MKGAARIYDPSSTTPTVVEFDKRIEVDFLHKAVGGYIELVPYFTRIDGKACVAFCNEDGKREALPINVEATRLWWYAAAEAHGIRPRQLGGDVLVGSVVVITGDRAFMESL